MLNIGGSLDIADMVEEWASIHYKLVARNLRVQTPFVALILNLDL